MISNILYFNSLFYPQGRVYMEEQLQNLEVPHRRIEALSGNVTFCEGKPVCLDRLKVGTTYKEFLQSSSFYLNSDGTTLILHRDDVQINTTYMSLLLESVFGSSDRNSPRRNPDWRLVEIQCDKKQGDSVQVTKWSSPAGITGTMSHTGSRKNRVNLVPGPCNRTHGILWRNRKHLVSIVGPKLKDHASLRRAIKSSPSLDKNRYCLVADPSYCRLVYVPQPKDKLRHNVGSPNKDNLVTKIQRFRNKATLQEIQREVQKRDLSTNTSYYYRADDAMINRIFYNNLDKNGLRRHIMEGWLHPLQERYNIPYKRISAIRGEPGVCAGSRNTTLRCMGVSGIHRTLVKIIDEEDTSTGLTWVLEDDYVMTDDTLDRLQTSLNLVPNDWELIRFDCWGAMSGFQNVNKYVVQTNHPTKPVPCSGAHSMLWRDSSSIYKLRQMWSQTPYQAVDCIIPRTSSINSYCINIGLGDGYKIDTELTDIIKH